jgi:signal transduction histidine kinase
VQPLLDPTADLALRLAGASDHEVNAVVISALEQLARSTDADRGYVTLYHEDGTFEISHEWVPDNAVPHRPAIRRLPASDFAYSAGLARRGEIMAAPDISALPDEARAEQESFSSFGIGAVLQVPIVVNDEGIGLVGFNHLDPTEGWEPEFVELARRVGQVIGVILVRQRALDSMRRAYEEAAAANQVKDQFLEHVSHELRTPLHAILGYAELMELDERSSEDRDALLQIQFNGRHLLTMLEDLTSIAASDRSPNERSDVKAAIIAAIEVLGEAARARSISFDLADSLDGASVRSEVGRLRQVVYCVLSSAVQGLERHGRIEVDVPLPETIRFRLHGVTDPASDIIMPMAATLLGDRGEIDVIATGDDSVEVDLRFDGPLGRPLDPRAQIARP